MPIHLSQQHIHSLLYAFVFFIIFLIIVLVILAIKNRREQFEHYLRKSKYFETFQYKMQQMIAAADGEDIDFSFRVREDFNTYYGYVVSGDIRFFKQHVSEQVLTAIDLFLEVQTKEAYLECKRLMQMELLRDKMRLGLS